MLLRSGTRGQDVLTLASRLVAEAGSLAGLLAWSAQDFRKMKGIGRVKALQLVTVMEVAARVAARPGDGAPLLNSAELVAEHFRPLLLGLAVEKFWVLCLNVRGRLLKRVEITSGTATSTLAHPREVFRAAMREAAASVVCVHNHPSGDPSPSAQDLEITRQLRAAARVVEMPLLDHVIVGRPGADPAGRGFYSFRAAGVL